MIQLDFSPPRITCCLALPTKMTVNIIKFVLLVVGIIGYLTGNSQVTGRSTNVLADDETDEQHHRDKRNIYLNSKSPILIAAYITIPISVAFPALQGRSARSGSADYFNGSQAVPYSYDDPLYRLQLEKIDLYMDYIGVWDDMCRQRFLCEIAQNPTTYSPLYSIFKKQLSPESDVTKSYSNRFFRYLNALEEGRKSQQRPLQSALSSDDDGVCQQLYGTCPNSMSDTVNMDVLRVMQYLTKKFKIQFADTA